MTTGIHDHAKRLFLGGEVDLLGYPVRATLVDVGLHPIRLSEDRVIGDVPAAARVATVTLANVRQQGGRMYADDLFFPAVGRLDDERQVGMVLWVDRGGEDSTLICAWGAAGAAGVGYVVDMWPLRVTGGDVRVLWGENPILDVGVEEA